VFLLVLLDVSDADHQRARHFDKMYAVLAQALNDKLILRFPATAHIPYRYEALQLRVIRLDKINNYLAFRHELSRP
jgi:hypothetical protein